MPRTKSGRQAGETHGDVTVFAKRSIVSWVGAGVIALGLAYFVGVVVNPEGRQFFSVEIPNGVARTVGKVGSVVMALGLLRRLGSLRPGAPAVVTTPEQIINYTGDGWFPPHPRARWDEVVAVRTATRMFQRELVLELRNRRPIRVGLAWLSEGEALELRRQIAARTGHPPARGSG